MRRELVEVAPTLFKPRSVGAILSKSSAAAQNGLPAALQKEGIYSPYKPVYGSFRQVRSAIRTVYALQANREDRFRSSNGIRPAASHAALVSLAGKRQKSRNSFSVAAPIQLK